MTSLKVFKSSYSFENIYLITILLSFLFSSSAKAQKSCPSTDTFGVKELTLKFIDPKNKNSRLEALLKTDAGEQNIRLTKNDAERLWQKAINGEKHFEISGIKFCLESKPNIDLASIYTITCNPNSQSNKSNTIKCEIALHNNNNLVSELVKSTDINNQLQTYFENNTVAIRAQNNVAWRETDDELKLEIQNFISERCRTAHDRIRRFMPQSISVPENPDALLLVVQWPQRLELPENGCVTKIRYATTTWNGSVEWSESGISLGKNLQLEKNDKNINIYTTSLISFQTPSLKQLSAVSSELKIGEITYTSNSKNTQQEGYPYRWFPVTSSTTYAKELEVSWLPIEPNNFFTSFRILAKGKLTYQNISTFWGMSFEEIKNNFKKFQESLPKCRQTSWSAFCETNTSKLVLLLCPTEKHEGITYVVDTDDRCNQNKAATITSVGSFYNLLTEPNIQSCLSTEHCKALPEIFKSLKLEYILE